MISNGTAVTIIQKVMIIATLIKQSVLERFWAQHIKLALFKALKGSFQSMVGRAKRRVKCQGDIIL